MTVDAIAAGAVTGAALADGAVTAAKLGLANTTFVAADGFGAIDNCDGLIDALSAASGPAAVVLGPGLYDCGNRQVRVPAGVLLRGSGSGVTTIAGQLDDPSGAEGVVSLGDGSALSDLSVVHTGGGETSIAVSVPANGRAARIRLARLIASDGPGFAAPILVEAGGTAAVIMSQLIDRGGLWALAAGAGAWRCISAYDAGFATLDADCG